MQASLLVRYFLPLLFHGVFLPLSAAVSQPKADPVSLSAAGAEDVHVSAASRPSSVAAESAAARAHDLHETVPPHQGAQFAEVDGSANVERGRIRGHVNGRGVYVADAEVDTPKRDPPHKQHENGSDVAAELSRDGGIHKIQAASFMRRGQEHDKDYVLDDDGLTALDEDEWPEMKPASLAESEATTVENAGDAFNWWDRRRRRRRYDCRWTEWEGWKACTRNCGAGEKQRDRKTDGPHWGGKVCSGPRSEYSTCNVQNCGVDCEWNHWGAWGPCSKTCGTGNRVRQRGALPFTNRDGGAVCAESQKKKTGVCNAFACPIPCTFSSWSLWGGCSKTCGTGGLKRRTRRQVGPQHGGAPCNGANSEDDKCNAFMCPVDCSYTKWGGWGPCSRTCGGGIRLREREYLLQAQNGGAACPGSPAEVLACNVEECPQDCLWGHWHEPGPCSKTCGGGVFSRHRAVVTYAHFGGTDCEGPNTEIGPCNVEPCAVDCQYSDWEPWGECSASCGGGIHTAKRNGSEALHGGRECTEGNLSKEDSCNERKCPAVMVEGSAERMAHVRAVLALVSAHFLWWQ